MITKEMVDFLKDKANVSGFFASLLAQYERKGSLTPRQLECLCKEMKIPVPGLPENQQQASVSAPRPQGVAVTQTVREYLEEKSKVNWFFSSLLAQANRTGLLSPHQMRSVDAAMERDGFLFTEKLEKFTVEIGEKIEINRGLANRLKKKLKMSVFFSNLEIVKIHNENRFGYLVDVRFVSGVCTNCHCCGKDLDVPISKSTGIGPVCAKKYLGVKRPDQETAERILALLDKFCLEVGILEKIWIPKEKILARLGQAHAPDSGIHDIRKLEDILGVQGITAEQAWNKAHQKIKEEKST